MLSSEELLREFARDQSEEAFRQLVDRHLNLVFATAVRVTGNRHFAEDVSQVVFRDLAHKAAQIPQDAIVAGWLYRHASFTAGKFVRTERRRVAREQRSTENPMDHTHDLSSRLEPALEKLREADRNALVLRFLESRDLREVGQTLGITEDAAQKRVSRALEKLRGILATEGLSITASSLALALEAQLTAAPASLSSSIIHNLATQSVAPMTSHFFATTKGKLVAGALAALAVGTPLWLQQRKIQQLTFSLAAAEATPQLDALRNVGVLRAELERLRRDNAELHKLRAEVTALRGQMREADKAVAQVASRTEPAEPAPPAQVTINTRYAEVPAAVIQELQSMGIPVPLDATTATLISPAQARQLEEHLEKREGVDLVSAPKVTTLDGRQARIAIEDTVLINGEQHPVGTVLDVLPSVSGDRRVTTLKMEAKFTEFLGISESDNLPRFLVRQSASHGSVRNGQALLLQAVAPSNTGAPEAPRKLLVLVQSILINPDGTRADAQ